jgi:hypothetical protein
MANAIGQPIYVDTPEKHILTANLGVRRVVWYAAPLGAEFVLTDKYGHVIAARICEFDGQTETFDVGHLVEGVSVPVLTGGTLYIWRS